MGYSEILHYSPKDKDLTKETHPAYEKPIKKKINKLKSKQVKGGLKKEKELSQQIAKQTLRSGAILQDGDISLFDGDLKLDSKVRYNKGSFTVTKAEYEKGINQSLDGWIITNKNEDSENTVVCLTFDSFTKLLAYKRELEKHE